MWNDRDVPIAYLITFRCYGTWLPGDARGTIDHLHNQYKMPYREPNKQTFRQSQERLKSESFKLNTKERGIVDITIREVCDYRNWVLHAINVRTNHAHIVVSIGSKNPSKTLNSFKSYATRKLREEGLWKYKHSPWARRGSKRFLWNEKHLELAIDYVVNGQGKELPQFT